MHLKPINLGGVISEVECEAPPNLDLKGDFEDVLTFLEEYDLRVGSLRIISKRDNSGSLKELHHGEFIPQANPNNLCNMPSLESYLNTDG